MGVLIECGSVYHMRIWCLGRLEERVWCPGTRITGSCELPRGCWKPNLGPLGEHQPVLVATKSSLFCICHVFGLSHAPCCLECRPCWNEVTISTLKFVIDNCQDFSPVSHRWIQHLEEYEFQLILILILPEMYFSPCWFMLHYKKFSSWTQHFSLEYAILPWVLGIWLLTQPECGRKFTFPASQIWILHRELNSLGQLRTEVITGTSSSL